MNQEQIQAIAQAVAQAVAQALSQFASDQPTQREAELEIELEAEKSLRAEAEAKVEELQAKLQAWETWGQLMPMSQSQPLSPPSGNETQPDTPTPVSNGNGNGHHTAVISPPPIIDLESFTPNHQCLIKGKLLEPYEKVKSDYYLIAAYNHWYKSRPKELSIDQFDQLKAASQLF